MTERTFDNKIFNQIYIHKNILPKSIEKYPTITFDKTYSTKNIFDKNIFNKHVFDKKYF